MLVVHASMQPDRIELGFVRRATLAFLLAGACAVSLALLLDSTLSLSARFLTAGAILVATALLAMTVKVSADRGLRRAHFGTPQWGYVTLYLRFQRSYRKRFGTDIWLVMLLTGIVAFLLGVALR